MHGVNARRRCLALLVAVLCVIGWAPALGAASAASAQVSASEGQGVHPGRMAEADPGELRAAAPLAADVSGSPELPAASAPAVRAPGGHPSVASPRSRRAEPGQPRGPPAFVVS